MAPLPLNNVCLFLSPSINQFAIYILQLIFHLYSSIFISLGKISQIQFPDYSLVFHILVETSYQFVYVLFFFLASR